MQDCMIMWSLKSACPIYSTIGKNRNANSSDLGREITFSMQLMQVHVKIVSVLKLEFAL